MKVSIVQGAQLAEAVNGVEIAQASGDATQVHAAFARLALVCDPVHCSGFLGWFRKRPSRMTAFEFLTFAHEALPRYGVAIAADKALVEQLVMTSQK
jgi:hypothetical protein